MVNLRLQSILASMAKYYWILHYLSLLLSRLKHSFICKGVIGQNADIHFVFCNFANRKTLTVFILTNTDLNPVNLKTFRCMSSQN